MPFDPGQGASARPARMAAAVFAAMICLGTMAHADPAEPTPAGMPPQAAGPARPALQLKARATLERRRPKPSPETPAAPQSTMPTPADAKLLDRLCASDLRTNEEDRLFGLISLSIRATIRYDGGEFSPSLIDDAAQDSLEALIDDCPRIVAANPVYRLGIAIESIQKTTQALIARRAQQARLPANKRDEPPVLSLKTATAADLSEELTSPEIDAWLDGLSPRERALALFLYASDVTPTEVADAVGIPEPELGKDIDATKTNLMGFFQEKEDATPNVPVSGPAAEFREAGTSAADLLQPDPPAAKRPAGALRITGISTDLYAGWSLLGIAVDLPADKTLDIDHPFVLATDFGGKRYIVVAAAEISKPDDAIRRFLFKAYAIDGDNGTAGFHDTLHFVSGRVDNPAALATLHNPELSNIEIARCLWHDYGAAPDPGLCRSG